MKFIAGDAAIEDVIAGGKVPVRLMIWFMDEQIFAGFDPFISGKL